MPCHMKAHLMHTKIFLPKESTFWDCTHWSDETKIELFSHNDMVMMIWRKRGEAFLSKNTISTVQHGGGNHVMGLLLHQWHWKL